MRRLLVALVIFAACAFVQPAIAAAQNVLDLGATGDFVNLDCCAQIAEDPTAARTLEQAKTLEYAPFGGATLSHRQSAYWIRLRYRSETTQPWVFTAGYRPRSVTYYVDGDLPLRSGGDVPYEQRSVRAFNWIVFDVPPESRTHDVYLRVQSDEPLINLVAYSRDRFRTEYTRDIVVVTALLAILCALALSSVVLYFVMRDTLYLYYAAYIVLQALYRANDFGLLEAYVLPHLRFPYVQTEIVFDGLTLIAATLFIRRFLRSHAHSRLLDRANIGIACIGGL